MYTHWSSMCKHFEHDRKFEKIQNLDHNSNSQFKFKVQVQNLNLTIKFTI